MSDHDPDWGYHGEYFPPDMGVQSYNELSSQDFNDFLIKLLKGFQFTPEFHADPHANTLMPALLYCMDNPDELFCQNKVRKAIESHFGYQDASSKYLIAYKDMINEWTQKN